MGRPPEKRLKVDKLFVFGAGASYAATRGSAKYKNEDETMQYQPRGQNVKVLKPTRAPLDKHFTNDLLHFKTGE